MHKDTLKTGLAAALLAFLASLGGVGCLMSGMRLEANVAGLLIGCAVMALAFGLTFHNRLVLIPACIAALALGYWWQEGTLRYSLEGMIYAITTLYDQGYGWGVLQWSEWHLLLDDATPALLLVALPVVVTVAVTTVKGKLGLLGSGLALLPMLVCVLLKDTVPAEGWLGLLLFAVVMILLTENVRSRDLQQGNRLVLMLSLPLLTVLLLLFVLSPRESYNGQEGAQKLEDFVLGLFEEEEPPELFEEITIQNGDQEKVVRLDRVGSREETDTRIMTVKGQESGLVYLRGCAYDAYDGTSWSSTPGWNSWNLYYGSVGTEKKSLTIRTEEPHSVLYFTYAPADSDRKVVGGRMRNEEEMDFYTTYYLDAIEYSPELDEKHDEIGGYQLSEYLQLPNTTLAKAQKILHSKIGVPTETDNAGQTWKNAMLIADWVSHRADYDLNAAQMPQTEEDFAIWFLEKGRVGYCTHFASSAVVLLRAAGIPAQYVTGYLVQLEAGKEVTVTSRQAHAWVEVFINGIGWVVLEATPGAGSLGQSSGGGEEPQNPPTTEEATAPQQTQAQGGNEETVSATETGFSGTEEGTEPSTKSNWWGGGGNDDGQDDDGDDSGNAHHRSGMVKGLLWVLGGLLAVVAVVGQWRLRVSYRHRKLHNGTNNARALVYWHQIEGMARLAGQTPPEEVYWLAQKARFSQHTLTREELLVMASLHKQLEATLRSHGLHKQLFYTLILALY